ncbi:MAG TPA: tetratricopeptide repeat protein [Methyloceanibacter sp.]|nr:tetratricopeptide repeat protein [Methyloceanibacter sp.]
MESFSRAFFLDWVAIGNVLIVLGLVAAAFAALAAILWQLRNRRERRQRAVAEKIAVQIAGEMMTSGRRHGDRFALKESNSIKRLVMEAVLALAAEDPHIAGHAMARLGAAKPEPAAEVLAAVARAKRAEAEQASRETAAALRHQGALTLAGDPVEALDLFREAAAHDPASTENLLALALAYFRADDLESLESLAAAAEAGEPLNGVGALNLFAAILHFRRGNLAEAIEKFSAAKDRFEAEGDAKGEVDALIALANAELQAGNRDAALLNFNRAAALCTENKYELGFAQLYADLGLLLLSLGKTQEAEQMMIKSLAIADQLGETAIAALAAGNLSLLYRETQDLDHAEAMARQALRFEGQLERKDGVARASLNLGTILFERARLDEAGARFAESLRLYEELGPPDRAAQALFNLGNVHRARKQTDEAETSYRKAVDLFLSVNDAGGVAGASGNLGTLYLEAGRLAEAEDEFNIALEAAREAGDKRAIAMQMRNLAVLAHARGETVTACEGLRQSLALCTEINAHTEAVELKVLMGQIGCGLT